MSESNMDCPAFPVPGLSNLPDGNFIYPETGMTLRQYAAIKLCVPNSGTEWLDEMIRESLRDRAAEKAMVSLLSTCEDLDEEWRDAIAKDSYWMADAMLKAKEASR